MGHNEPADEAAQHAADEQAAMYRAIGDSYATHATTSTTSRDKQVNALEAAKCYGIADAIETRHSLAAGPVTIRA